MKFALEHYKWQVPHIIERAMKINLDMFKDDYGIYLHPIFDKTSIMFSSFLDICLPCFEKFTEYFISDKNHSEIIYKNALAAITYIWEEKEFTALIEKILPVLENSRHRREDDGENKFRAIYAAVASNKLKADERVHDVLADLTAGLIEGSANDGRVDMECLLF